MIDDGQTLYNAQQEKLSNMYKAIDNMAKSGKERAELQRKYRIALKLAIAEERKAGTAAAIVSAIAKGETKIAKLEEDMEVAAVKYAYYQELVNAYKCEANLIEGQMRREWTKV